MKTRFSHYKIANNGSQMFSFCEIHLSAKASPHCSLHDFLVDVAIAFQPKLVKPGLLFGGVVFHRTLLLGHYRSRTTRRIPINDPRYMTPLFLCLGLLVRNETTTPVFEPSVLSSVAISPSSDSDAFFSLENVIYAVVGLLSVLISLSGALFYCKRSIRRDETLDVLRPLSGENEFQIWFLSDVFTYSRRCVIHIFSEFVYSKWCCSFIFVWTLWLFSVWRLSIRLFTISNGCTVVSVTHFRTSPWTVSNTSHVLMAVACSKNTAEVLLR